MPSTDTNVAASAAQPSLTYTLFPGVTATVETITATSTRDDWNAAVESARAYLIQSQNQQEAVPSLLATYVPLVPTERPLAGGNGNGNSPKTKPTKGLRAWFNTMDQTMQ